MFNPFKRRDRAPELADDELFARVATGREHIIRDDDDQPVAVIVPYLDYLIQRAEAAFDRP